jgi:Tol biopolymer transport system component/DNA-binding winged helix-turn-helix (wHTH) protein
MQSQQSFRFGEFKLDVNTCELRNNGRKLDLQGQPFQILAALLEQPGQLITRAELKRRLWPSDTFVDFDHSLNRAVNRLREALEDSAEHPRFIETLPRRGYRFIAPVEPLIAGPSRPQPTRIPEVDCAPKTAGPEVVGGGSHVFALVPRVIAAGCAAGVLALLFGGAALWLERHQSPSSRDLPEVKLQQLTADSSENAVTGGAISPDGKYLAYANLKGIHIRYIETGETRDIPQAESLNGTQVDWNIVPTWASDGTRFVANAMPRAQQPSIWMVPAVGGTPRKIRDDAFAWTVSRDGSWVAFGANMGKLYYHEIWLMRLDGGQARKLYEADKDSAFLGAEWSPDGQRLAYVKWRQLADNYELNIESRDLKSGPPATAVSVTYPFDLADWVWLPDGRIIYSAADNTDPRSNTCNFWQVRIDPRTGRALEKLNRLTNWSGFCMDQMSLTAAGKRLTFRKSSLQSSVFLGDLQADGARITTPRLLTLNEARDYPVAWAADGKAIYFASDRNGEWAVFRQSLHKDTAEPNAINLGEGVRDVTAGTSDVMLPRLSPDGAWIFYIESVNRGGSSMPLNLMKISVNGGPPQVLLTTALGSVHSLRCAKSPATLCLIAERNSDQNQLTFTAFDSTTGRGREVAEFDIKSSPDAEYSWDLAPDGTRIAWLRRSEGVIHILSLEGRASKEVAVRSGGNFQSADWSADGKGLFVSGITKEGSALWHVDLNGKAQILWVRQGAAQQMSEPFFSAPLTPWVVPSPDGRHLAICASSLNSNMWMMEEF